MRALFVDTVQLVLGCSVFIALVFAVSRSALAGAGVALGAFVLFEATSPPVIQGLVFQQGSFSIYPLDLSAMALLTVGVWRLLANDISGPVRVALLTLVVSIVVHLAWGVVEFGVEQAIDYSRAWFAIASGIVFGATARNWDHRLPNAFIATGFLLAVLSVIQITRTGLHSANTFIEVGGEYVDARPTIAIGVLVMLQAIIMLFGRGRLTLASASLVILLAGGIALLQYRTVWIVSLVCALLGAVHLAMRYRRSNERAVYALTGVGLLILPMLLLALSQSSTYRESAETAAGPTSTLAWRIEAWKTLLGRHSSAFEILVGTPSGTERRIVVDGRATNLSAHDMYVEALLLFGLVGLVALCALSAYAVMSRNETARQLGLAAPAIVILLASQALVAVMHIPNQVEGLLFGCLLAAACTRPQLSQLALAQRRPDSEIHQIGMTWSRPAARTLRA